jgi:acetone carboxylase gamma subunit
MKQQNNRKPLFSPQRLLDTKLKAADDQSFGGTNKTGKFHANIKVRDEQEKSKKKPTKLQML